MLRDGIASAYRCDSAAINQRIVMKNITACQLTSFILATMAAVSIFFGLVSLRVGYETTQLFFVSALIFAVFAAMLAFYAYKWVSRYPG